MRYLDFPGNKKRERTWGGLMRFDFPRSEGRQRKNSWCGEQGRGAAPGTLYTARDTKVISAVLGAVFVRRKNQ